MKKTSETTKLLKASSVQAVNKLIELMSDKYVNDNVKLNAASKILSFHYQNVELRDLEASIEELKALVAANPQR
jgi:uncharacterized protein YPO0396